MNRNVSIVIALLVVVVIAGYLVWLRSKVQPFISPQETEQVQVVTPVPAIAATPSATPGKEATSPAKPKTATAGATKR